MSLKSNIPFIIQQIKKNEKRALEMTGIFVQGEAKIRTPVDSGRLRDSIDYRVIEAQNKVVIGTNAEYSVFVEKGTGRFAEDGNGRRTPWVYKGKDGFVWTEGQRPQPYLTPAFEENKKKIKQIIAKELEKGF